MRTRQVSVPRTPVTKLADIFCKIVDVAMAEQALACAPCHDLSRCQWEGILFIQRHEYCSIRDLAEGLAVSHPAAVKMVERLVRKNLVDRRESARDRRVVELSLSEFGQQCFDAVRQQRAQIFEAYMADMDPEETECLLIGLNGFLQAALKDRNTADAVCLHCGREHVDECSIYRTTGNDTR